MLKRDISTVNVLIASAGGMIGSGWLFSPFISAQMAGSNALLAWVIVTIFMLFIALPLCELGAFLPISGGMANYPTLTHGAEVGFLFAWAVWLSYVVMTPIEIQAILQYGSHFFPSVVKAHSVPLTLSPIGYLVAIGMMFVVCVLNSFGVKLLAECNKYASILKFLLPSIAIVALCAHSSFENIHLTVDHAQSWTEIFSAISLGGVVFAFTGFQNGLMLAGEVHHPQRNIPIAILGAVGIGFVLYFLLQLSFLMAVPTQYLANGWHALSFPGDSGPLVGLTLLLGLGMVAFLLMCDAMISPFGTTLVYTAATSRILYGMAMNQHLPKILLKENRYHIPYVTLYINFLVGCLAFLPLPGWQKMVAFLSSTSVLSYGVGPICLLALRTLQPEEHRPFRLSHHVGICVIAFYVCNLMLYWSGFDVLWKLCVAMVVGFIFHVAYQGHKRIQGRRQLAWFAGYLGGLLLFSAVGSFGGLGWLTFPLDMVICFPLSCMALYLSQRTIWVR